MLKTHVNVCETVRRLAGFLQSNGGKLEDAEDFKSVSIVYCVGQLYDNKSLALRARDLIFSTTDPQTVNYYTTNHCLS